MTILSAQTIAARCQGTSPMVFPFHERTVVKGKTFGLSAAGYDVRVVFGVGNIVQLRPGGFLLAATKERFIMPDNMIGMVHDKSSWARKGLAVQNTIIEPGWRGYLTLELTNHGNGPIIIEAGEPIAQIVFQFLDHATMYPYAGKYQDQNPGPQPAIEENEPDPL